MTILLTLILARLPRRLARWLREQLSHDNSHEPDEVFFTRWERRQQNVMLTFLVVAFAYEATNGIRALLLAVGDVDRFVSYVYLVWTVVGIAVISAVPIYGFVVVMLFLRNDRDALGQFVLVTSRLSEFEAPRARRLARRLAAFSLLTISLVLVNAIRVVVVVSRDGTSSVLTRFESEDPVGWQSLLAYEMVGLVINVVAVNCFAMACHVLTTTLDSYRLALLRPDVAHAWAQAPAMAQERAPLYFEVKRLDRTCAWPLWRDAEEAFDSFVRHVTPANSLGAHFASFVATVMGLGLSFVLLLVVWTFGAKRGSRLLGLEAVVYETIIIECLFVVCLIGLGIYNVTSVNARHKHIRKAIIQRCVFDPVQRVSLCRCLDAHPLVIRLWNVTLTSTVSLRIVFWLSVTAVPLIAQRVLQRP